MRLASPIGGLAVVLAENNAPQVAAVIVGLVVEKGAQIPEQVGVIPLVNGMVIARIDHKESVQEVAVR